MELIQQFGINWYLLTAQIVNFLIIFYLLKRFAYKPILKMLEKRRKIVEEGVKNAQEIDKVLVRTLEKEKEVFKKAQSTAQQIILDAKKEAMLTQEKAVYDTRKQVEKMLAEAQDEMKQNAQDAEKKLALQTTKISIEVVEKVLSGLLSQEDQAKLVKKATGILQKTK